MSTADTGPDTSPATTSPESTGAGTTAAGRPIARVVSYRSRRDALTPKQQRAWDTWWPTRGAHVADVLAHGWDPDAWFGRSAPSSPGRTAPSSPGRTAPRVLEIGCGTGVATAAMAAAEPDVDVLAVDVYRPGLAQLLGHCEDLDVGCVRVLHGDAVPLLAEAVAPASLAGVRVFFPDPWPKNRHHKRRLLSRDTLALVASRLQPGGVLHVATDVADYAAFTRAQAALVPELVTAGPDDPAPVSLARPTTKFERRAAVEGSPVTEIVLTRRD